MGQSRRVATWAGALLGVIVALACNAVLARASDDNAFLTEEFHHSYPLVANGRVELENINGSVQIAGWDRDEVKVDAVKRASDKEALQGAQVVVDARSDSISIRTQYLGTSEESRAGWRAAEVDYTITVPRKAQLDEIKLVNGQLDISSVTGKVRAYSVNGKLAAHGLTRAVTLETVNGPLAADFTRLEADTVELSSVNGSLRVTLPSDVIATIEASTVHGMIANDFGLHARNHRFIGHDLRGQLGGGGGVEIRLRNVNGKIDLEHANDGHALSPARDEGVQQKAKSRQTKTSRPIP